MTSCWVVVNLYLTSPLRHSCCGPTDVEEAVGPRVYPIRRQHVGDDGFVRGDGLDLPLVNLFDTDLIAYLTCSDKLNRSRWFPVIL